VLQRVFPWRRLAAGERLARAGREAGESPRRRENRRGEGMGRDSPDEIRRRGGVGSAGKSERRAASRRSSSPFRRSERARGSRGLEGAPASLGAAPRDTPSLPEGHEAFEPRVPELETKATDDLSGGEG